MPRVLATLPLLIAVLAAPGCNQYEPFRVTGFEQANFNNNADILFIIDNSDSMQPVAADLALNISSFINTLTSEEAANVPRATLSDAVANYIREISGDTLLIDYQLAITTSSVSYEGGSTAGIDPGEAGSLVGDPPVIDRADENVAVAFQRAVLCEATCWSANDTPFGWTGECTETPDPGGEITQEYLDCLCGAGAWTGHCGSGNEMGLEAAVVGLCRAVEDPPESCYEYEDPIGKGPKPTVLTPADEGSNAGFLRDGAQTVIVLITDEGDGSYRMATGDTDIEVYTDIFAEFPQVIRLAVVGPGYNDGEMPCNSGGAQSWAVERYQNAVAELQGAYYDIEAMNENDECAYTDFGVNLEQIGQLLSSLLTYFPLQAVPDPLTIEVWVDKRPIDAAPILSGSLETGDAEYGDGWSYLAAENAVAFHGAEVPDYNSDVEIYYRPLGGNPRDLPSSF